MLSPLQRRVQRIISELPEAGAIALAGSGALIARGLVDRESRDVDFFTPHAHEIQRLLPALTTALAENGLAVERVTEDEFFCRLRVSDHVHITEVDLGVQMRLRPMERTPDGPVLHTDELAGGKLSALCDRGAARDYADLADLTEAGYSLSRLCDLAAERNYRFKRPDLLAELRTFDDIPRADFPVDDARYNRIRQLVVEWRTELGDDAGHFA